MAEQRRAIVLVTNPTSGRAAHSLDAIRAGLKRAQLRVLEEIPIQELDRLRRWTGDAAGECPLVVAAGGDGTVGSVAGYVVGTQCTLGILPVGTSNDVARSLDIPLKIDAAIRLLHDGDSALIDIGRFDAEGREPRYFLHAATAGVNVAFARMATQSSFRKRLGKFTYLVAGLIALEQVEPFACEVINDGKRTSLCLLQITVVNAPIFGGFLHLTLPQSRIDDHRLDILAIEAMPIRGILLTALRILVGDRAPMAGIRLYHVRDIAVHTDTPLEITLDGEIASTIPGSFSLHAEALRVLRPRAR